MNSDDKEDEVLRDVNDLGRKIAKIIDDTIAEIEHHKKTNMDICYVNVDKQPPEVKRLADTSFTDDVREKIAATRLQGETGGVVVMTVVQGSCRLGLSISD